MRLAAKEQVESLGGKFIDVPGQQDLQGERRLRQGAQRGVPAPQREEVAKRVADADLVITTALDPRPSGAAPGERGDGRARCGPARVVVDLAVESGGNCARSVAGEVVDFRGVKIVGAANLPASVPRHASELYARNVLNLVLLFVSQEEGRRGQLLTEFSDEVVAGCLLTQSGAVVHGKSPVTAGAAGAAGKGGGA